MNKPKLPKEFIKLCKKVTARRPRVVIDHILKHGHITTEELKSKYGYDHPPRAARDVREQGIPLVTSRVTGSTGRKSERIRLVIPPRSGLDVLVAAHRFPRS